MECTETALHFEGDGITPETVPTQEFLAVAAAYFECVSRELIRQSGHPVRIFGFGMRHGRAGAFAFVEAPESEVTQSIHTVVRNIADPKCREDGIQRLRTTAERYSINGRKISVKTGADIIYLKIPDKESTPQKKHIEIKTFKARVSGVWTEYGKARAEVFDYVLQKSIKLSVTDGEARNLGKNIFEIGYISAKLETIEGIPTGGEFISFRPCNSTTSYDDIETSFRLAFHDTSLSEFLKAEREECDD